MPRFKEFTPEQQAVIEERRLRLPAMYKADPNNEEEFRRVDGEYAIRVIELMPVGIRFTVRDIEASMLSASNAIRAYLKRMAWKDQDRERWLMEDLSWYSWQEGEEA